MPEAAKLLGLAVHSAYALIERGELHAALVGRTHGRDVPSTSSLNAGTMPG